MKLAKQMRLQTKKNRQTSDLALEKIVFNNFHPLWLRTLEKIENAVRLGEYESKIISRDFEQLEWGDNKCAISRCRVEDALASRISKRLKKEGFKVKIITDSYGDVRQIDISCK
jgi:hypothetical protein